MENNKQRGQFKRVKTVLSAFLLMASVAFVWNVNTDYVYASEPQKVDDYLVKSYSDITSYRQQGDLIIPVAYDNDTEESNKWLFAGWYTDEKCTTSLGSGAVCTGTGKMEGTYYAKFVSADVLSVKCQITANTKSTDDSTKLRCVSSVDSLMYKKIGFDLITPDGKTKYMESSKVGARINATTTENAYSFSPKVVDTESEYFFSAIETIEQDNFDKRYIVQPYWITKDGTKVYGVNKYVTVMEGVTDKTPTTIYIPVKMDAEPTGIFTVEGGNATAVTYVEYKSGYAHFAITVADRNALNSATLFTIKQDGTEIATYIYRNLTTQYNGSNADKSWYEVYKELDDEYVIATSADLYGFAQVVDADNKFSDKTVYLVNDIEANKGYADKVNLTWNSSLASDGITQIENPHDPYKWTSIGSVASGYVFNGVFDGQMHTISGIYLDTTEQYAGMFAGTGTNANVQNFSLTNSYVCQQRHSSTKNCQFGSIVGNALGTFETIYTDAIVDSYNYNVGGMIGATSTSAKVFVTDCWFDGVVTCKQAASYYGGLIGYVQKDIEVKHCLNTGSITNTLAGTTGVGAMIGYVKSGANATVSYCVNTKAFSIKSNNVTSYGLMVGLPTGTANVSYSYSLPNSSPAEWGFAYGKTYDTCNTYSAADVAGLKALTADTKNLFTVECEREYWSITKGGFPILTSFAKASNITTQAVDTSWYDESIDEYILKDSGDLYGLALLSQTNSFAGKDIKLGADITINQDIENPEFEWMSIGTSSNKFQGDFDGQTHTISGLYQNSTKQLQGFFGDILGDVKIANFSLENSYFNYHGDHAYAFIGAVAGRATGRLENIYVNAVVESEGRNTAGFVGSTSTSGALTITNCWNAGPVSSASTYTGSLIGCVDKAPTIMNCLNTGAITTTYTEADATESYALYIGGFFGNCIEGTSLSNCLNLGAVNYVKTDYTTSYGMVAGYLESATFKDIFTLKQDGTGDYNGASNSTNVTKITSIDSIKGTNALTTVKNLFTLQTAEGKYESDWSIVQNGAPVLTSFAKYVGEKHLAIDTSWYDESKAEFTLVDSGDLYGLALLSQTNTFAGKDIKLGADITINQDIENPEFEWMSIGTSSCKFQGDFNGQMHTISGLYQNSESQLQGLFADVSGEVLIANFSLENSYFNYHGDHAYAFIGAVAGRATGCLENIYVNAVVESEGRNTAGFVGSTSTSGALTIINCWNAGPVSSTSTYTGSLIGYVDKAPTIMNCLNTGAITTTSTDSNPNIGGFLGNSVAGSGLYNCLNTGTVNYNTTTATSGYGSMVGNLGGSTAFENLFTIKQENLVDYNGTSNSTNVTKIDSLDDIKGENASNKTEALLSAQKDNGESYWSIVPDGHPVLTTFINKIGSK